MSILLQGTFHGILVILVVHFGLIIPERTSQRRAQVILTSQGKSHGIMIIPERTAQVLEETALKIYTEES